MSFDNGEDQMFPNGEGHTSNDSDEITSNQSFFEDSNHDFVNEDASNIFDETTLDSSFFEDSNHDFVNEDASNNFDEITSNSCFFEDSSHDFVNEDASKNFDETTLDSNLSEDSNHDFVIEDYSNFLDEIISDLYPQEDNHLFIDEHLNFPITQDNNGSNPQNVVPVLNPKSIKPRTKKTPINLKPQMSKRQREFMENFYELLTGNKKKHAKKEIIIYRYHPFFMRKLGLRKVNRKEKRNICLYFIDFVQNDSSIMETTKELKKLDIINYQRDKEEEEKRKGKTKKK